MESLQTRDTEATRSRRARVFSAHEIPRSGLPSISRSQPHAEVFGMWGFGRLQSGTRGLESGRGGPPPLPDLEFGSVWND